MAFSGAEVASIANASIDYYFNKGETFKQLVQERPLLKLFENNGKSFPGGKGNISIGIKGATGDGSGVADSLQGYTHNDTVSFYTPANIKRANFAWKELHLGLTCTHTELKVDGISVVDTNGEKTSEHSNREMTVLVGLLEDKLYDLAEQYAISMEFMLAADGTQQSGKQMAGLKAYVSDDPSVGVVGGIDRAVASHANGYWRNRAFTAAFQTKITGDATLAPWGGNKITSNVADGGALITALNNDYRQLSRYGGRPNVFLCGSDFMGALEKEYRANGQYSTTGFSSGGDTSVGALRLNGGATPEYCPTFDSMGRSKFGYWLDKRRIFLMKMEDEWRKSHSPARPPAQFLLYRSITSTGQLVITQPNSCGVYELA
jgi:hypothetical protein